MLSKKELEEAKKAWENIKKQARIDMEQAEIYLECLEEKIKNASDN